MQDAGYEVPRNLLPRTPMNDLAAHPAACTIAYFHHQLFSSGEHGNQTKMRPTWDALYAANADVVLNGHHHDYERFAPQTQAGRQTQQEASGSSWSVRGVARTTAS